MTDWELLGAFGFILGFFACLAALIVILAIAREVTVDWWRARKARRNRLGARCEVYTLREDERITPVARSRPALFSVPTGSDDRPAA